MSTIAKANTQSTTMSSSLTTGPKAPTLPAKMKDIMLSWFCEWGHPQGDDYENSSDWDADEAAELCIDYAREISDTDDISKFNDDWEWLVDDIVRDEPGRSVFSNRSCTTRFLHSELMDYLGVDGRLKQDLVAKFGKLV